MVQHDGNVRIVEGSPVELANKAPRTLHADNRRGANTQQVQAVWQMVLHAIEEWTPGDKQSKKIFERADADGSGYIQHKEFAGILRNQFEITPDMQSDATITAVFEALDADGSGKISAGEFDRFMKQGIPLGRDKVTASTFEEKRAQAEAIKADVGRCENPNAHTWT